MEAIRSLVWAAVNVNNIYMVRTHEYYSFTYLGSFFFTHNVKFFSSIG